MAENIVIKNPLGRSVTYGEYDNILLSNSDGDKLYYSKLPTVTEEDDGKVLGVADGKWQTMTAPSGGDELPDITEEDNGKVLGVTNGVWGVIDPLPSGDELPDVTTDDNGKFLGVTNGVWTAKKVPAPESYPASQVTGLAPVATLGAYESLYYAPVGPKYVIPRHSTRFEFRGNPQRWTFSTVAEYAPNIGTECEVEWEGIIALKTVRDCAEVAGLADKGYGFIGNASIITGDDADDTGEEFLFVFVHQQWPIVLCYTNYRNATNAFFDFQITIPGQVKKLDKQYLPDGIATEEFVRNAVASGGGTIEDILPETVFEGFEYAEVFQAYMCTIEAPQLLHEGDKCVVSWDGTEYPCTVKSAELDGVPVLFVGNSVFIGEEDTGEPFVIGYGNNQLAFFSVTNETSHTIRIYQGVSDNAFYEETVSEPFFSDAEMVFTCDPSSESTFTGGGPLSDDLASAWIDGDWDTATVRWDGKSYTTKRFTLEGMSYVGNSDIMMGSGDNGEPFIIAVAPAGFLSDFPVMLVMPSYDTPDLNAEKELTVQHTLGVDINQIVVHKIEDKYQHQADWLENDESKAGHILNRPFYQKLAAGEVLAECESGYDEADNGFWLMDGSVENILAAKPAIPTDKVHVGAHYTIRVGEDVYSGIGITKEEYSQISGGIDNGVPFTGGIRVLDGYATAGFMMCGWAGLTDILTFTGDYLYRYTSSGGNSGAFQITVTVAEDFAQTIDRKFLPGPPEFDLTAMGLPDVPMDGTIVSAECNTTELMTALSKGPVWYSANYTAQGATFRATGMSSQVASNGAYQLTNINYFGGFLFAGVVIVVDGQIQALCKPITTM